MTLRLGRSCWGFHEEQAHVSWGTQIDAEAEEEGRNSGVELVRVSVLDWEVIAIEAAVEGLAVIWFFLYLVWYN